MGRKFYIHPASYLDGKWVCPYCDKELPLDKRGLPITKKDWPCITSPPIPFDEEVEVSVWNCQATVLPDKQPIDYDKLPKGKPTNLKG